MKEQYVGDISDYRKYALLRALTGPAKLKPGICWMLTPPDGRSDGNKVQYLDDPSRWRSFDPPLFDLLKSVVHAGSAERLRAIEESGILEGATYLNDMLPDDAAGRARFFARATQRFAGADLVFFDPDNGLEIPSKAKGRKDSSKFLYFDEVAATYAAGQSILIYQHFVREERSAFIARLRQKLQGLAPDATISSFRTSHVVFMLLAQPRHAVAVGEAIRGLQHSWPADFVESVQLV